MLVPADGCGSDRSTAFEPFSPMPQQARVLKGSNRKLDVVPISPTDNAHPLNLLPLVET